MILSRKPDTAMEPEQGEGGYIVPPKEFVQFMRDMCDKYGIMLIFDEVQCGNGRTGKLYCQEHFGVRPDFFSTAKGIGAGFPLSAVIGKTSVMEKWLPGAHGNSRRRGRRYHRPVRIREKYVSSLPESVGNPNKRRTLLRKYIDR